MNYAQNIQEGYKGALRWKRTLFNLITMFQETFQLSIKRVCEKSIGLEVKDDLTVIYKMAVDASQQFHNPSSAYDNF